MGETMFDDKFFDDWLDGQAQKVMEKVASGEGIAPEQMMILMLKGTRLRRTRAVRQRDPLAVRI